YGELHIANFIYRVYRAPNSPAQRSGRVKGEARLADSGHEPGFPRRDRTGLANVDTMVAAGSRAAGRRAERAPARARRRRIRPARLLRLRHLDADIRRPGPRRNPAHQLPHDRALLAD